MYKYDFLPFIEATPKTDRLIIVVCDGYVKSAK